MTFRDELSVTLSQVESVPQTGTAREPMLVIRPVPLGGSPFSQAMQRGELGQGWFAPRPATVTGWTSHLATVRKGFEGADWLTTLAPAFAATGAAAERLARAAAGGVVVTTGQQPGLFGGPMYTLTKALGALAFANELERATGVSVAPVFWAASDDADWAEAATTSVAMARGLLSASLAGPASEGVALSDVALGRLDEARAALAAACGSAPHRSVLDLVDAAYVPHATIGAAYVQLLRAMLEPLGIAVLDAAHASVRHAADGFLRQALKQAPAIHEALRTRVQEIERAGFSPQVDVVDGLSLVFHTRTVDRQGIVSRVRERVPFSDATTVAREAESGALGANVLLRPVLERSLLPTATYLAGPGEYAYFAQVEPVARALGAAVPVVAPRFACEVIEQDMMNRMAALGLTEADLRDPHAAERMVALAQVDDAVADSMERLRVALETQVRALQDAVGGERAPVPGEVVQGLSRDLSHRIDRFERRVLAGVKRLEIEAMREVAAVRAAIRPRGQSPERVLNIVPFLVRYGIRVLEDIRDAAIPHARALVAGPADQA